MIGGGPTIRTSVLGATTADDFRRDLEGRWEQLRRLQGLDVRIPRIIFVFHPMEANAMLHGHPRDDDQGDDPDGNSQE
jgi:hypothetical protein